MIKKLNLLINFASNDELLFDYDDLSEISKLKLKLDNNELTLRDSFAIIIIYNEFIKRKSGAIKKNDCALINF